MTDNQTGLTKDNSGIMIVLIGLGVAILAFIVSELSDNEKKPQPETTQAETSQQVNKSPVAGQGNCEEVLQLLDSREGKNASLEVLNDYLHGPVTIHEAKMYPLIDDPDREGWLLPEWERLVEVYKDKNIILQLAENLTVRKSLRLVVSGKSGPFRVDVSRLPDGSYELKAYWIEKKCE